VLAGPSAKLTAKGEPVGDARIDFTTRSGKALCSAITNDKGTARCGVGSVAATLLAAGYKASFSGDETHAPSTAAGSVIVISGHKLL
jgi:uncharacterized protein YfaS (alpha-2-macroglobulin family)